LTAIRPALLWALKAAAILGVLSALTLTALIAARGPGVSAEAAIQIGHLAEIRGREEPGTQAHWSHAIECVTFSIIWRGARAPDLASLLRAEAVAYDLAYMPCTMLRDAAEGRDGVVWRGYARYWHANTVPVSLALSAFGADGLRPAMLALLVLGALAAALGLGRMAGWPSAALFLTLMTLFWSQARIDAFPTQAIALSAALFAIGGWGLLPRAAGTGTAMLAAFTAGAAVNAADFLYVAGLTAGALAMLSQTRGTKRAAAVFGACLCGYGAMFAAKWGLTALLAPDSGPPVLADHALRWLWPAAGDLDQAARLAALAFVPGAGPAWAALLGAFALAGGLFAAAARNAGLARSARVLLPAAAALVPMIVMIGHTINHMHIVARTPETLFALVCALWLSAALRQARP